jgi:hypothetical protein
MALSINNIVYGNVSNDYGLDNVPYTVSQTGSSTALLAYVGWTVAQYPYQATGKSPAVNVTDSAGNLWRQIGISTVCTQTRGALWIADNPRQVEWVSVALTGWGEATAYQIMEMDSVPTSMGSISLDFVKTINSTAFSNTLTLNGTASTTDIVFGLVTTGGNGGALTVPTGWTGIGSSYAGGNFAADATTYAMWIPGTTGTLPAFTPHWANSVPSTGIIVGLKETAASVTMTNANMPAVTVEAAFGATPGDYTQSVDYTYDITGLTWTDITKRAFSKGDDGNIKTKRGRQYELNQEETGELEIRLDNHDGALTYGNTSSIYYPNVIPNTPIRVTAWWNGIQYPVAFGYVESWGQAWPDMPQWGFTNVMAVDAYGPLSASNLPSAVIGEVGKESPYFYFPTSEQYEFTSQSLTPTAAPLDANGLIAINWAFGNNRYGAYRDGSNNPGTSIPVTTGQALNLLGDENTCLGATTYGGQGVEVNGPGMFYFDPNIPTNFTANTGFSLDFWFVWGNTNIYSCELFSAFGRPSAFYSPTPQTAPTVGGVIAVGVNCALPNATVITSGFYCNGVELTNGAFNQDTFAPQHFALTTGPNGTTTYLNGVATANQPSVGTIPQIRAVALGPARFSYDQSNMIAYNAFNYNAGHIAWYPQELTATQVSNHYEAGISGWSGVSASGRFAQALTWGRLGMKRGGTAWYQIYGQAEGTYMSEAYDYQGSSAADIMNQVAQTERGRCFTQANGSIVYVYRWYLYNLPTIATFTDNITNLNSGNNFPYETETSFAVDNQFIFNQVQATQQRGPDQDIISQQTDFTSYTEFFLRSGLSVQSYAMLPFDVFDVVNWNLQKYKQPTQRCVQLSLDITKTASKFPNLFPVILGLELNQVLVVTRTPVGGATITITGIIQSISHEIGATYWKTILQITPLTPENQTLFSDVSGSNSPNTQYLSW